MHQCLSFCNYSFKGRLRQCLLKKGAASAVFEGLRLFIGFSEPKFEKCLQYSCQALVALIMAEWVV